MDLSTIKHIHFIGVAGTGMSAIAQYLSGTGHVVSGSDREFTNESAVQVRNQLEAAGIQCFLQDGRAIHAALDAVIISTAIEETVPELRRSRELNIPVLHRADMLKAITETKKTIAISGTSGKSTTTAMVFHILQYNGLEPSIISGAGLVSLQKLGKIGNAFAGKGEWLVIEADESDGSLVKYTPETGVILNLDKDHKEMAELYDIFETFKKNIKEVLIVNAAHAETKRWSQDIQHDFGYEAGVGFRMKDFVQTASGILFSINDTAFKIPVLGRHNMENAAAAVAAASVAGVSLVQCSEALETYPGIYRRVQVLGVKNGVTIVDDYAHNPVKIAAAISTFQPLTKRVIAWFQPHGYGPTKFLRDDFVNEISQVLRDEDEIWMSEIFYAGGTAIKDISAADLISGIKARGKRAFFTANRDDLPEALKSHLQNGDVLLLMGARDPSLEAFAEFVMANI